MSDLPKFVHIREEGPREGFQIESGPISTSDKIGFINALSETGLKDIQVASFVSAKAVPGWADAEAVVEGFDRKDGVNYSALWFSDSGLKRVLNFRDKLNVKGSLVVSASDAFSKINLGRSVNDHFEVMGRQAIALKENDVAIKTVGVMAAFGCNYAGKVSAAEVISAITGAIRLATDVGETIEEIGLGDSMGWCTPERTEALVGAIRERWPELKLVLHLHDTRGLGIACAYVALKMGVDQFDSTVAGLGGCPFAGRPGASGNIASEELVLLCHEMGIETGVDLDALADVGRMAERLVGHQLPSTILRAGGFAVA